MTRERGPQRSPLSPLRASNQHGGGSWAATTADAVGSSTKDRGWQQRRTGSMSRASRMQPPMPQSDKKKNKKVEGTAVAAGDAVAGLNAAAAAPTAAHPPPASRIPARSRPAGTPQQQPAPAAASSRIPRPPAFGGASPVPDYAAMLSTPAPPPQLEELQQEQQQEQQQACGEAAEASPQGFHAYSNPSFDGGEFLAPTPPSAGGSSCSGGSACSAAAAAGTPSSTARPPASGLAAAEAEVGRLTPGLLESAALTPASERSLEAWLRASPTPGAASRGGASGAGTGAAPRPPASAAGQGAARGGAMPTPEAWQLLQHISDDSPAAAPKGVRGIMNAFLRTGPQMLSPEPACAAAIRAPGAAPVPATGLLNVTGPGGMGVYGLAHAYLRTGANTLLSPEPGVEAAQHTGQQPAAAAAAPLLHPYSPASPLAATPGGPLAAAAAAAAAAGGDDVAAASGPPRRRPTSPSSVCSNGEVDSDAPAGSVSLGGAAVPRLDLAGLRRPPSEAAEASLGAGLAGRADSPGSGELPTARLLVGDSPAAARGEAAAGCAAQRQRRRPPSPVTFCLPGDSPGQEAAPVAASDAPTFSFGMAVAGCAAAGSEPAATAQHAEEEGGEEGGEQGEEGEEGGALPRIPSGETVQQAHPFKAMLQHLQGPQYASPARLPPPDSPDSPHSPRECTPLHLISAPDTQAAAAAAASPGGAVAATPAPGQGSMTVWMERRGMRGALATPARADLRRMWAAARDLALFQSEAAALRADNAALAEELEAAQAALREAGAEQQAAAVAAQAGALCAEAEVARARDAAAHMMRLADQIQGMFALCETEKEGLVGELQAAQRQLAAGEAAAAGTAHLGQQAAAQLAEQLEEARQAVAAAQQAAAAAQQRAGDAADELLAIRRQLAEAQRQLAASRDAQQLTPMARLRGRLGGVQRSLAQLHAEQCAGRAPAGSPEMDQLLEASRGGLAHVEQLLGGGDALVLRGENECLHRCLAQARSLLAESSPAAAAAAAPRELRSPLPFALFGRGGSEEEGGDAWSPATTVTLAAGSPDVFASPFLASQTTLTVDYRHLHGSVRRQQRQADSGASRGTASPAGGSCAASLASEGSSGEVAGPCSLPASASAASEGWGEEQGGGGEAGAAAAEAWRDDDEEAVVEEEEQHGALGGREAEYTVVHNGMVITHVPASQVSKVQSMVQYWEAVASGTPAAAAAAGVTGEEAAEAEAYACAAVAAAEAALGARQAEAEAAAAAAEAEAAADEAAGEAVAEEAAGQVAQLTTASSAAQASPAAPAASPAATPGTLSRHLPAGEAATPCGPAALAGAATPARPTPLNFVSAPPPTPASGSGGDPQHAQQLHQLAVGMAAAAAAAAAGQATPPSAQRSGSRLPGTPAATPASCTVAAAVTPLALSALRARMGGSGGGVQDAVRSRLARLKRDLMAAQAKLATVDQGLASIAFTPTSSITASGTPGSRASSLLRRTPPTPGTAAPLGSLIAAAGSSGAAATASAQQELSLGSSSRAAAMIAAGSYSPPLVTAHASPSAVNQASRLEPTSAAAAAAAAPASAPAQGPITTTVTAAAAAAAPSATGVGECTPPATRRSVRFADMTRAAGSERGMLLRMGTPYSHSTAAALPDGSDDAASPASASASPVVASSRRSPLGVAGRRIAAPLRSPPAEAQSAARPAAAVARFALERGDGGWGSSSGSDEDGELLFDASRMAQRANRQATPSPARRPASGAATPMAHPERYGGFAAGCGGAGAATPTTATSMLSTSSFSPPRPLALLAVRPLGRMHRRGALLRGVGAAGGRRRSEADEREFRRRAAALNIQVSPYFRRPRGGQAADGE